MVLTDQASWEAWWPYDASLLPDIDFSIYQVVVAQTVSSNAFGDRFAIDSITWALSRPDTLAIVYRLGPYCEEPDGEGSEGCDNGIEAWQVPIPPYFVCVYGECIHDSEPTSRWGDR